MTDTATILRTLREAVVAFGDYYNESTTCEPFTQWPLSESIEDTVAELTAWCEVEAEQHEAHASIIEGRPFHGQSSDWNADAWLLCDTAPDDFIFYVLDDDEASLVARSRHGDESARTLFLGRPSDCKRAFDTMKAIGFDVMPQRIEAEGWPVYKLASGSGCITVRTSSETASWQFEIEDLAQSRRQHVPVYVGVTKTDVREFITPPKPCTEAELRAAVKAWQDIRNTDAWDGDKHYAINLLANLTV